MSDFDRCHISLGPPRAPGVVVVITDSISSDSVSESVKAIKQAADRVIVVGLGYAVDKLELESVASKPSNANYIEVHNSANLGQHVGDVTKAICETEVRNRYS